MRVINFNAGPAALPLPALERARDEFLDFKGSGMSIMEHSHRGKEYEAVQNEAVALLKELLGIPDTHRVLFLQGGASLQFAMVPMNFLPTSGSADYVVTGTWSEKALAEAQLIGKPRVAASTVGPDKRYTRIPKSSELKLDPKAAYVHLTSNNTIFGTQWQDCQRSKGHSEDSSILDPCRGRLALQHSTHLCDLHGSQCPGLGEIGGWPGAGRNVESGEGHDPL